MPDINEMNEAVAWALQQQYEIEQGVFMPVSIEHPFTVVDKVREYLNTNSIVYDTFSFADLQNVASDLLGSPDVINVTIKGVL